MENSTTSNKYRAYVKTADWQFVIERDTLEELETSVRYVVNNQTTLRPDIIYWKKCRWKVIHPDGRETKLNLVDS